jgi:DNA sulfur modification protein DndE
MKAAIDNVKICEKDKEILIKIKKNTGIDQWNVLCRIAFLLTVQKKYKFASNYGVSKIDLDWKTFSGKYDEILKLLIDYSAKEVSLSGEKIQSHSKYLEKKISLGISEMKKVKNVLDICKICINKQSTLTNHLL